MSNVTSSFQSYQPLHFQGLYPQFASNTSAAPLQQTHAFSKASVKLGNISKRIEIAVTNYDANLDPDKLLYAIGNEKQRLYRLRKKVDIKAPLQRCIEIEQKIFKMQGLHALGPISEPSYVQRAVSFLQSTASWLDSKLQFFPAVAAQSFAIKNFANRHESDLLEMHRNDLLIEMNPQNGKYYTNRAFAYFKMSMMNLALEDAIQAVTFASDSYRAHYILGKVYQATGDAALAKEAFIKCRQLNQLKTVDDYFVDAIVSANLDDNARAKAHLKYAYDANPQFYEKLVLFRYYRAVINDTSHDAEVLLDFTEAFNLGFTDPVEETKAHFHYAVFMSYRGSTTEALQHLERAELGHIDAIKDLPSYNLLKGIFELLKNPESGYIDAQRYFDKAASQKLNVREELVDWFTHMQRPDIASYYFQSRLRVTNDRSYYYQISEFLFQAVNLRDSMIAYRLAVLADSRVKLNEINHKLFDITLFIEREGNNLDFYALQRHLKGVVGEIEQLSIRSPAPDEDFAAGILHLLIGNADDALLHMIRAKRKNAFYDPFVKLVERLQHGKKQDALQTFNQLLDHFVPVIRAVTTSENVVLRTLGQICLVASQLHDSLDGSNLITKTAFAVIKKMLFDEDVDLTVIKSSDEEKMLLFLQFLRSNKARASAVFLGIAIFVYLKRGRKVAPTIEMSAPIQPQLRKPRAERKVLPYTPSVRSSSPDRFDERESAQKKIEQFQNEISQLFEKSSIGLEVVAVQSGNFSFKVLLDCKIAKYRSILETKKEKYSELFSTLFGDVITSKSIIDDTIYRWVFEIKSEEKERDLTAGLKAVQHIENEVKDAFAGVVAKQNGEWEKMLHAVSEVNRSRRWEKELTLFFAPIGNISVDPLDEQLQFFVSVKESQMQEHCMNAESLDAIQKQLEIPLEIYYDFKRAVIVVNIPKGVECPTTLQPLDLAISESASKALIETVDQGQLLEETPVSSSSLVSVGYAAPRGPSSQQIWKKIEQKYTTDAARIKELSKLIGLLKKETAFYVQKSIAIRFLEIYKRLTFWKLRPDEKNNANLVRNSLMHHEWLVKEHEFLQLIQCISAVEESYQVPYRIHNAIVAHYSLNLKRLEFLQELQQQTRISPEAGSEFEKQAIDKMKECCKEFLTLSEDVFSKEGLHAYRCGLILTIRELFQAQNMSLETKNKIEDQLRLRKVLISREFNIERKEIVEKNELTNLGDRLAHGDVSVDVHDIEMEAVMRSLPAFIEELSLF
jgi:hypothetical protein